MREMHGCEERREDGPDGDEENAAWAESPGALAPVKSPFCGEGEDVAAYRCAR